MSAKATAVSVVLKSATDLDLWGTVEDPEDRLGLPPDMYQPPTKPPPGSAFAPLPGADHDTPPPWFRDINGGETTADHNLFRHFLELGPHRTVKGVAEDLEINPHRLYSLSSKFSWSDRANAYDTYKDEQYEVELLVNVKEMAQRHAKTFSNALSGLAQAFDGLGDHLADELLHLSVKDRLRLATQAAKAMPALAQAERLALGMPTELIGSKSESVVRHEMDLDGIKDVISGLMEAGVMEKQAGMVGREEIIDAEVVDDDDD